MSFNPDSIGHVMLAEDQYMEESSIQVSSLIQSTMVTKVNTL
jgi:hypothetical protein